MHGEADDLVGHTSGDGEIFPAGGGEAAVGGEFGYEGVEVTASEDVGLAHLEVEFVAGHAILLSVDEDGEV